jgi:hypothetical protein
MNVHKADCSTLRLRKCAPTKKAALAVNQLAPLKKSNDDKIQIIQPR